MSDTHKVCPACARDLPLTADYFAKNAERKDGFFTYCKSCDNDRRAEYDNLVPALHDEPIPETFSRVVPVPPVNYDERSSLIPPKILNGAPVPHDVELVSEGIWRWKTPKGWRVLAVHYSADPKKRPGTPAGDAWLAKAKALSSPRDWQREMELDYTISANEPFFPNFSRIVHVKPCAFDPTKPLIRGWDFGQAHPACVWAQIGEHNQLKVLYSLLETNKKIWEFADEIIVQTNTRFPGARKILDYGDPAGAQESDKGQTTAILLDKFGITLYYQWSYIETGLKMLDIKLRITEYGEPGLVLDPINHVLIQGFEGGYVLDTGAAGRDKEGRLKNTPKKDGWFEHVMDALRYLVLNAFTFQEEKRDDDEAWNRVSMWRTNKQIAERHTMDEAVDELFL
jgi:hypothetical protein